MKKPEYHLVEWPLEKIFEKYPSDQVRKGPAQAVFDSMKGQDGVELPEEGGVLSWQVGQSYPYKGIMVGEPLVRISIIKKILVESLRFITSSPVRYFVPLAIFIPRPIFKRIMYSLLKRVASVSFVALGDCYLRTTRFCKSGREIYRAGTEVLEKIPVLSPKERKQLIMAVCMVWNFEPSYRYTIQDLFGEINKEKLKKSPVRELRRLLDLAIVREVDDPYGKVGGVKNTWRMMKFVLPILKMKGLLDDFLAVIQELDLEKVALDDGDLYHFLIFPRYNCRGLSLQERWDLREILEKKQYVSSS